MKLIICDKNKELIKAIREANIKPFRGRFNLEIIEGDVFETKEKYPSAKICTASNPKFSAGGGLDKALKEKYPSEWNNLKEFVWTDNLFPLISVNSDTKAEEWRIKRSLVGVFAYLHKFDLILTGIGTAIGGLEIGVLIKNLLNILSSADLSSVDLSYADLRSADLSSANLSYADLRSANLRSADLRSADLSSVDLRYANLSYANLSSANLRSANLRSANLRSANLRSANLSCADLSCADLSMVKNMIGNTKEFIKKFKFNKKGMIVYKGIGNTPYDINPTWKIKKGEYLEEVVNPCKNCDCGCGVNFGTIEYIKNNYPESEIWECLIEFQDLVDVVVPYNTDGKARCSRLKLIKTLGER